MIRYCIARVWWEIRWWIWMWRSPCIAKLVLGGVDKQSRRLIYRRHDATAPEKPKRDDYRQPQKH